MKTQKTDSFDFKALGDAPNRLVREYKYEF